MIYKSDFNEFIKLNYLDIVKLCTHKTNGYGDIDFVHDIILSMCESDFLKKFDPNASSISSYTCMFIQGKWSNITKSLKYKAQHIDIYDFNTAKPDSNIDIFELNESIDSLELEEYETKLLKLITEGYKEEEIANRVDLPYAPRVIKNRIKKKLKDRRYSLT